jgi:hypothetical protein
MGTSLITTPSFSPESYEEAAKSGATLVSLVSTALQRIDPTLFRAIVLGGSRQAAQLPPNCITTYGLTETGSGVVYNGKALRGVELEIRDCCYAPIVTALCHLIATVGFAQATEDPSLMMACCRSTVGMVTSSSPAEKMCGQRLWKTHCETFQQLLICVLQVFQTQSGVTQFTHG